MSRRRLLQLAAAAGASSLVPRPPWDRGIAPRARAAAAAFSPWGYFQGVWQRTDQPVAAGQVSRTWMWGPAPFTDWTFELYAESPYGLRRVQYFDKARMEITHPDADSTSPWYVTNGLIAKELITGQLQLGDNTFETLTPAVVNVAGDADDPNGPTYATFSALMGYGATPNGWALTQTVDRAGHVAAEAGLASYGVTAIDVGAPTHHTVASVFWAFMTSNGLVLQGGQTVQAPLFANPFYATGYPLTEAYWTTVRVGGVAKQVLVQVFERRVLTYTPDNPAGWQVEAGNVGQHYYAWRYGRIAQLLPPPTLRDLAAAIGFDVGTAIPGYLFYAEQWRQTVLREFNQVTIDGGLYWSEIEPARGQFAFDTADQQVTFAQANGLRIRGHPLVFPSMLPDWLKNGGFGGSDLADILQHHVQQIVGHYHGKVAEWVVVNEALNVGPYRTDIFYQALGSDYITLAFRTARQTDSAAVLLYNDTLNDTPTGLTTNLTRQIVQQLKPQGLIDGVGLEMHLDGTNPPDKQDVIATMRSYGLPVYVTEFDIDLQNVPGTQAARFALQAQIAGDMVQAARESGVCKSFGLWEIGDNYSWIKFALGHVNGDATPLDSNLEPKPMFYALIDAMK